VQGLSKRDEIVRSGEWGLFRLLEKGKVRKDENGSRKFYAQWDLTDEGLGVVQVTFEPSRKDTPFFGLGGRKNFMSIFRTRDLTPPRSIISGAASCPR
jgi:type VI protein secretion system component VasK